MPTHPGFRVSWKRGYSFHKRTKWICPSNELLLIWHTGHKLWGISLISSSHMCLSVCPVSGTLPFVGNLKRSKQIREVSEAHEYSLFYLDSLSGRQTIKTRLKSYFHEINGIFVIDFRGTTISLWNTLKKAASCPVQCHDPMYQPWLMLICTRQESDPCIAEIHPLSVLIVTQQPEPVLQINSGL